MSHSKRGWGGVERAGDGSGDEWDRGWVVTLGFGGETPAVTTVTCHPVLMCAVAMFGLPSREMLYKHLFRSA